MSDEQLRKDVLAEMKRGVNFTQACKNLSKTRQSQSFGDFMSQASRALNTLKKKSDLNRPKKPVEDDKKPIHPLGWIGKYYDNE